MPIEANMIEFCYYIPTNSFNIGPDTSSFFFLLLDAQSPPSQISVKKMEAGQIPFTESKRKFSHDSQDKV